MLRFKIIIFLLFLIPLISLGAQASSDQNVSAKADVLKMASADVGDDVLLAYVQTSKTAFNLTADDIIALKNAKVGSAVIQAILNHDAALRNSSTTSEPTKVINPDPATAPAPEIDFIPPPPGPDFIWTSGYWAWRDDRWIWMHGVWTPHRPFYPHHRPW